MSYRVGPSADLAPWLAGGWERFFIRAPPHHGPQDKSKLVRYIQCSGAPGVRGAAFVDLRVHAEGPPAPLPASLEACGMEHLVWIFCSVEAFAGVSCVLEEGGPSVSGCGPEVVCWHSCFRVWPPEEVSTYWAAIQGGQHPTGDCGRVRHTSAATSGQPVSEWYEFDLSGESYEELWRRLPPLAAAGGCGNGSLAMVRHSGAPFELLVVNGGRFGYFRDSRSPELVRELRELHGQGQGLDALLLDASRPILWRRSIVDCEVSVGVVNGWQIEQSVLPWRVGTRLRPSRSEGWEHVGTGVPAPLQVSVDALLRGEVSSQPPVPTTFEAVD